MLFSSWFPASNTDPKRDVRAIIRQGDFASVGHNKFVSAESSTTKRWFSAEKYLWVMHAEEDAIHNAYQGGLSLKGAELLVSYFPCARCANHIARAGITSVIAPKPDLSHHRWGKEWSVALQILQENNVHVEYSEQPRTEDPVVDALPQPAAATRADSSAAGDHPPILNGD